jgi:Mg-chelatase subunit ChlD
MELKKEDKQGAFFSIDALMALLIIFLFIVVFYPYARESRIESPLNYDILNSLSAVKISEINTPYVQSLISQGLINDTSKSVLEQMGEFYVTNLTIAKALGEEFISNINTSENIGIWYGFTLIASRNSSSYETADNIDVATEIISGIQRGNGLTGYSARAYLSRSLQSKYFYFGGYIGDGNITAIINYAGNISAAKMELVVNNNFDLYVNNNYVGSYQKSASDSTPVYYAIPTQYFNSGNNLIDFKGYNLYIAGGFVRVDYDTDAIYEQPIRQYFPGVLGVINIYDSFYVPNTLENLSIFLHLNSSYQAKLTIGNTSVYTSNSSGVESKILDDTYLRSVLNYNYLSNNTNPIRLGIVNLSLTPGQNSTADVILITDTSGSMDWKMDADTNGTHRLCDNPLINYASTKRIDIAKCIDKTFIMILLNTTGNRVGLVSFSASVNNYINLTTNFTLLNSTIDTYTAAGSTCLSCAINQAYLILQSQGTPTRQKYIVVMTDGVANVRSIPLCYDTNSVSSKNLTMQVGNSGSIVNYTNLWNPMVSPTSTNLNGIDMLNSTFAFAVGDSYQIFKYNGSWSLLQDLGSQALYGVSIYNSTFAFAVGGSGKIARWNISSWYEHTDIGNTALRDVRFLNSTFAFAVGDSAEIYRWNGTAWGLYADLGNQDLRGLDIFNSTFAFAVGGSGKIYRWNGTAWYEYSDLGSMTLTDVQIYNATLAFATADNNRIYRWDSSSWTSDYTGTAALNTIKIINSTLGFALGLSSGGIIEWDGSSWTKKYPSYLFYGNLSSGVDCGDDDSCSLTTSLPSMNANYSSCRARADLNATLHSVGFGPVSSCSFAALTLQAVANCGNGSYYASNNATQLEEFYRTIANSIISLSYKEQASNVSGSLVTQLYPDSYIEFKYPKTNISPGLIIPLESQFYNNYSGNFSIPSTVQVVSANAISYSGPRWTCLVSINNSYFYNLSRYNSEFVNLGDPYSIAIPLSLISQNNTVNIRTGISNQNLSAGSSYDKIIYQILTNASSFTPLSSKAEGCLWTIWFEDNTNATIAIPASYSGSNLCSYTSFLQQYNTNDAFQTAAFSLLQQLDINGNKKIDVNIQQGSFQISESEITGIPFSWKTEVQVRTWD